MNDETLASEKLKLQVEIWKTAVQTQMHFNDLMVKTRQLFLSLIAALLAASIYLAKEHDKFLININWLGIHHISFYLTFLMLFIVTCMWAVETRTLLPLLRGAVKFNEDLEKSVINKITNTQHGMTELVSLYTKHKHVAKCEEKHIEKVIACHIPTSRKISLSTRINLGYGFIFIFLIICAFVTWNIDIK